jgi:hypothetical protein
LRVWAQGFCLAYYYTHKGESSLPSRSVPIMTRPNSTFSSRGAVPAPAPLAATAQAVSVSAAPVFKSGDMQSDPSLQISLTVSQQLRARARPRLVREGSSSSTTTSSFNLCPSLTGLSATTGTVTTVTRSITGSGGSARSDRSHEALNSYSFVTPTKSSTSLKGSFLTTDMSLSPLTIDSHWGTSASLASHDIVAVVASPPPNHQDAQHSLDPLVLQWDTDCDDDDSVATMSAISSMAVAGNEHLHTSLLFSTSQSGRSSGMAGTTGNSLGLATNESCSFPHSAECHLRSTTVHVANDIPTWIQVAPSTTMISVPRPPLLPPLLFQQAPTSMVDTLPAGLSPSLSVQDLSERLRASDATVTLLWHALQTERRRQQDQARQWQMEEQTLLHQQAKQVRSFGNALIVAAVAAILALYWGCWEGFGALVGLVFLLFPAPLDHDD